MRSHQSCAWCSRYHSLCICKVHEKQAIAKRTDSTGSAFCLQIPNHHYGPRSVLKLMENRWFSEGVRTNPIIVIFLSIFNLLPCLGPSVVLLRVEEVTLSSITYKVFGDFSGSKELCKHKTTIFNKCKQMLTQTAFLLQ